MFQCQIRSKVCIELTNQKFVCNLRFASSSTRQILVTSLSLVFEKMVKFKDSAPLYIPLVS